MNATGGRPTLCVFTRYPKPGAAKTRLIPALGAEGAANLHRLLAERAIRAARDFAERAGATAEIHFTGAPHKTVRAWLGPAATLVEQSEGDLGERMAAAFARAFRANAPAVAAIGTDCPALDASRIAKAFDALARYDAVIGPAHDGGYYLIALRQPAPRLFQGIAWGTGAVLDQTLAACTAAGLRPHLLPTLRDIDTPEDLEAAGFAGSENDFDSPVDIPSPPR
jgi:rSAM/selenodomain-associated transferase 1